jgi:hypothetical protein
MSTSPSLLLIHVLSWRKRALANLLRGRNHEVINLAEFDFAFRQTQCDRLEHDAWLTDAPSRRATARARPSPQRHVL